jgi:hypothetical protein
MDEDEDVEYVFEAGGDSCAECRGLDGEVFTEPVGLPHDGCMCQVSRSGCGYSWDYITEGSTRTGSPSGPGDYVIGFEVIVTCSDGDTIGGSIELDGHDLPSEHGDGDEWTEGVMDALAEYAEELADGCDCDPPLVA